MVGTPVLVELPVHRGRAGPEYLEAVHADVALPVARVVRDHRRERDERAAVTGPRGLHWEQRQVDVVALQHDLLAGAVTNALRARAGDRLERPQALHLRAQPFRRLHLEDFADALAERIERLDPEGEAHPALCPELVDEQRHLAPFRTLE